MNEEQTISNREQAEQVSREVERDSRRYPVSF